MELQEVYQLHDVTKDTDCSDFVTVVSVGSVEKPIGLLDDSAPGISSEFVTVLKIGETQNDASLSAVTAEEVSVYRLPGERLGFGLKFEGGTKASEYVKRLFIQSCAPDSPASRVRSSWGCLREGDEVIEIDSVPVKTMTRIDCVRCLKDSNVVIKLLVKRNDDIDCLDSSDHLPLVISAEKKRLPPPPPPVPPRKVSRKSLKGSRNVNKKTTTIVQKENDEAFTPLQGTSQTDNKDHCSTILQQSTDVDQQSTVAEDVTAPPDAEIYIDLLSQEPTYYMSESDDTGSSISTIVDRFSSYPTTTSSSVCSSLPTTPTSTQKQMDLTAVYNVCDEGASGKSVNINNDLLDQLNLESHDTDLLLKERKESLYITLEKLVTTPLQPPTNFQDAPLSYGDEELKLIAPTPAATIPDEGEEKGSDESILQTSPPPPPPRSKQILVKNEKNKNNIKPEKLPRLVDYLPKFSHNEMYESNISIPDESEIANNIVQANPVVKYCNPKENLTACTGMWDEDKSYTFQFQNYSKTSHLATIGEDEEFPQEKNNSRCNASSPTVIIINDEKHCATDGYDCTADGVDANIMEVGPEKAGGEIDLSRFKGLASRDNQRSNIQSIIAKFSTNLNSNIVENEDRLDQINMKMNKTNICDNTDETNNTQQENSRQVPQEKNMMTRNLLETPSNNATDDRMEIVAEQQRKRLSKLKGLIIPEQSVIDDIAVVDLPEIKTVTATKMIPHVETKHIRVNSQNTQSCSKNASTPSLTTPIWNADSFNTVPKYSPAFKRKHLHIFTKSDAVKRAAMIKQNNTSVGSIENINTSTQGETEEINVLENSFNIEKDVMKSNYLSHTDGPTGSFLTELHAFPQNESHSKVSQCNTKYQNAHLNPRLLKAQSVEAINRKNILASAKCRSGQDLTIVSPLMNRKSDIDKVDVEEVSAPPGVESNGPTEIKAKPLSTNDKISDYKSTETISLGINNNNRSYTSKNPNPPRVIDILKNFEMNVSNLNSLNKINSDIPRSTKSVKVKKPFVHKEQVHKEQKIGVNEVSKTIKKEISELKDNSNQTIVLYPEVIGGSVGITLAGGTDYETKEITVHKVRCGSPAHRDGRIKKGDRILSINGKSMNGLTHDESILILKENNAAVTLVVGVSSENEASSEVKTKTVSKIPKEKEVVEANVNYEILQNKQELTIRSNKDSSGLGFSIEGGRDSAKGDLPLVVKKVFMGGAAQRSGMLRVGDELISINGADVRDMARIDVWSLMKKIPDGEVIIKIRR